MPGDRCVRSPISRTSCVTDPRPVGDETDRQMIQQFRVARWLATETEVVHRSPDDPDAEQMAPDAVGHDPGRQRMVRVGQPAPVRAARFDVTKPSRRLRSR